MFFSNTNFTEKNVDVSGIRTRIVYLLVASLDPRTNAAFISYCEFGLRR